MGMPATPPVQFPSGLKIAAMVPTAVTESFGMAVSPAMFQVLAGGDRSKVPRISLPAGSATANVMSALAEVAALATAAVSVGLKRVVVGAPVWVPVVELPQATSSAATASRAVFRSNIGHSRLEITIEIPLNVSLFKVASAWISSSC